MRRLLTLALMGGLMFWSHVAVVSLFAAISDNLVSCWTMDEASGTRNDSAANANHLTDNNTVASAAGKIGNAADFELSNAEFLSIASNASLVMGNIDFTLVAWVNPESDATTKMIVSKNNGGSDGNEYSLYESIGPGSAGSFGVDYTGSSGAVGTSTSHSLSTWYFLTARHDATADLLKINESGGATQSLATGGLAPATGTTGLRIGRRDEAGNPFYYDGLIDEVAIWKRALSDGEITDLYNSGNGRACSYIVPAAGGSVPRLLLLGVGN